MASLSTCHMGLWLGWQILLNLVKLAFHELFVSIHIMLRTEENMRTGVLCLINIGQRLT